eukprot:g79172.t1
MAEQASTNVHMTERSSKRARTVPARYSDDASDGFCSSEDSDEQLQEDMNVLSSIASEQSTVKEDTKILKQRTTSDRGGFTFVVEPGLKPGGRYAGPHSKIQEQPDSRSLKDAWMKMAPGGKVEAMSPEPKGAVAYFTKQNLLAKAVHGAFFGHHPLILSPDIIWLTIAQGLANHVDQNAEKLRNEFVRHQGKKELVVERPEFVKGSDKNDWPNVFPEFSKQIAENSLPGTVQLLECNFSTTGPVERIVSHITLMDTVQHYFSYSMACGCGFPSITLKGTVGDWQAVREKAAKLKQYGLDWWLAALLPALDQFVLASQGKPDLDFWRSLCMVNRGLSFPKWHPITGWIQVFFPYLISPGVKGYDFDEAKGGEPKRKLRQNTGLNNYLESLKTKTNPSNFVGGRRETPKGVQWGVELELFPPGMASAPFLYKDLSTQKNHRMAFMGGVTTLVQHPDGSLEPQVGWAVLDSGRLK